MKKVFIVTGPPGSGKSTYVHKNAKEKDVIFDLDRLLEAMSNSPGLHVNRKHLLDISLSMRKAFIDAVAARRGSWENAYIITSAAKQSDINELLSVLDAKEIRINKTKEECINNIQNDDQREDKPFQIELINKWFSDHEADSEPKTKSTRDLFAEWYNRL